MSPAVAALMRPVGEAPVLVSPPAAVLADPAVALVPRAVAPAVPVDSAVGRVAAAEWAEAGDAADGLVSASHCRGRAGGAPLVLR